MTGLCAAVMLGVLGNAGTVSAISNTSEIWPDLSEYNDRYFIVDSETENDDSASLLVELKGHPYTEDELEALFHELPRYLESGSFVLNELNHNPSGHITIEDNLVYINGKPFPSRMPWSYLQESIASRLEEYQGD